MKQQTLQNHSIVHGYLAILQFSTSLLNSCE